MQPHTNDCRGGFLPLTMSSSASTPQANLQTQIQSPMSINQMLFIQVIFEGIYASAIKSAVLQTEGSAGPSGIDAKGWRRLCTSFNTASVELCKSLAALARRLCASLVDPCGLAPFLACRLIALDKNSGQFVQLEYVKLPDALY